MVDTVEAQALRYAARLAGSNERLAMRLQVGAPTLDRWLSGEEPMPDDKLLALLSLLLDAMDSREG
jgi:transcriptional regulator with XRE-family HTH domain